MNEELSEILTSFNIQKANYIEQIHRNIWSIDNTYILKRGTNHVQFGKNVTLSNMLAEKGIPVARYYKTIDGKSYYVGGNECYCLMGKISGQHMDPYLGNSKENGRILGNTVATLHIALKEIEGQIECCEANSIKELNDWIVEKIKIEKIDLRTDIIDDFFAFEPLYSTLPRQLIHRDMHLGNLMFDNWNFVGYLDFDISQKNVRIFDICYLGAGMLMGNYQREDRFKLWREIFDGVVQGYEEICPLLENERMAIPMMFIIIELTFTAFFSRIGRVEVLQSCIDMVNWLYDNKDKIKVTGY